MKLVKYQPRHDSKAVVVSGSGSLKTVLKTLKIKDIKRKEEEAGDPIVNYLIKNNIISPGGITAVLVEDINDITDKFGFEEPEKMIVEAVKDAARGNGRTWKFIYNKLNLWRKQGIESLVDLENYKERELNGKGLRQSGGSYAAGSGKSSSYEQQIRELDLANKAFGR